MYKQVINIVIKIILKTHYNLFMFGIRLHIYRYIEKSINYIHSSDCENSRVVLALSPKRFMSDLVILAKNKYKILYIDDVAIDVMNSVMSCGSIRVQTISDDIYAHQYALFNPTDKKIKKYLRVRVNAYKIILDYLVKKYHIISLFNTSFWFDRDLAIIDAAMILNLPVITIYNECMSACEYSVKSEKVHLERLGKYRGTHVFVHNNIWKKLLIESGFVNSEAQVSVFGALRMANVRKNICSIGNFNIIKQERKRATLFSINHAAVSMFHHEINKSNKGSGWSWSVDGSIGAINFFKNVHIAFFELALENPEHEFVIKTKWAGSWLKRVESLCSNYGIKLASIDNLKILADEDAQSLILSSDVVVSFGSTCVLEAGVCMDNVIIPFFDEVEKPEYRDRVNYFKYFKYFTVAQNKEQLKELVLRGFNEKLNVTKDIDAIRQKIFSKYLGEHGEGVVGKYIGKIDELILHEDGDK